MRLKFLFIIFLFLYLGVIIKLFYIQVLSPKIITRDFYLKTKKIHSERGKIYDRNMLPLVFNQPAYLIYLEPKKIKDEEKLIRLLSKELEVEESSISAKIDKAKQWLILVNDISQEKKDKIEKLNLSGVGFEQKLKRFYPEASLSAHILGFVGKNQQGEDTGYFGIEGFYDKDLTGLPGIIESERDLMGKPIFLGLQKQFEPENGRDLVLTIDKNVQKLAKEKLLQGLERYQAKQGCILGVDPKTMEIITLVCLPDYDPDNYFLFNESYFKNPIVSDVYEPGSIFKPLIMAIGINEKVIKPDEIFNETGPVEIDGYKIKTWNDKYEGKITMTRVLEKSSNVGMVYIGNKLGKKKIYQYLEKFEFGQLTNVDLQGENPSYLKPFNQWYNIDFATVTFGQGIAVTPIQMIRAFASLINGGDLMKPYIVKKIISDKKIIEIKPKIEKKVINPLTSEIIKKMLVSTVENAEAKWDKPKDYKIGGKTGTAQVAIAGHYDLSLTNASFIGFFPYKNPKILLLVILKEPKTSPWGSETAAPIFFELAKELISYYNILPGQ